MFIRSRFQAAATLLFASVAVTACAVPEEDSAPAAPPTAPVAETPAAPETGRESERACIAQPTCREANGPGAAQPYARHRGRDQLFGEGEPQWIIGNFVVRTTAGDLKLAGEVDVFVERSCSGQWERLGRTKTTNGSSPAVEGVSDDVGRVFFRVPNELALGVGRHRVRLVVVADQSYADLWLDVVPRGAPVVVADVDGTLTEAETPYVDLKETLPIPRRDAARALSILVAKGHHVVYVTSRPEWLTDKTREFLDRFGFPRGVVHTSSTSLGASGVDAQTFKTTELSRLTTRGTIAWAFGNNVIDSEAFESVGIRPVGQRILVGAVDKHGGRRVDGFSELLESLEQTAPTCR